MTAAAISMIAPASARAVSRHKGSDADDGSAPFASLLGSDAASPPEAPAGKARSGATDSSEPADSSEAATDPNAPPQLPAWLLALRDPPAAAAASTATLGEPAAAAGAVKGSTMLAGPGAGPGLDELRALKDRPGDTPPTQMPFPAPTALQADDHGSPPAGPLPAGDDVALLANAGQSLDASQSAALDAALARIDGSSTAAASGTPISVERAMPQPASPPPTASEAAASISALNASLANQTDAFGEPLSLHGHDAALKLGERLRWLTEAGVQEARMQLHPRELGSVDIRIRIEGQGASVWFGADHPGARAALEATLPQLRERLASEGLQLTQTSVGSQTAQHSGSGQQPGQPESDSRRTAAASRRSGGEGGGESVAATGPAAARLPAVRGLVDRYA